MSKVILGISAFYHDSAAALVINGDIIAAAQEERFTRKKHDANFPTQAIKYCLKVANLNLSDVHEIVFYDNPRLKFNRLLMTYLAYMPQGLHSFLEAMQVWLGGKFWWKKNIISALEFIAPLPKHIKITCIDHHLSHAASAFYPSPFQQAAVICLDGVGEWDCSTVWKGDNAKLDKISSMRFPHSLGLLYSAFTYYTGFKVNSGEYKLMGLAPYGQPKYVDTILTHLLDLKDDGSFRLNMDYFSFPTQRIMINEKFESLLGGKTRKPEAELTQREMDIARSIQFVTEEVVLRIARHTHKELGMDNLCMAGGVALNCVANGRILRETPFKHLWIQPAAGDAGGSLGAALTAWYKDNPRQAKASDDMKGSYLGPHFSQNDIISVLKSKQATYTEWEEKALLTKVAELLAQGNVIGWFHGRMEFGPRALGARSILADPRNPAMQSQVNLKIKFRESFRPFAPLVKEDKAKDWFEIKGNSPYMLLTVPVKQDKLFPLSESELQLTGLEKLKLKRSEIPAVTHLDYSARVQTVNETISPRLYELIDKFETITNCPVLINTSFNVRGEPIVCTPEDAYRCFMNTGIDYLVLENCLLAKSEQSHFQSANNEAYVFEMD